MIERKARKDINIALLDRINRDYQAYLKNREGEMARTLYKIMEDKSLTRKQRDRRVRLAEVEMFKEIHTETEGFFRASMALQYNYSQQDLDAFRVNKMFMYEKSDNGGYENRQRRAASDKNKDRYVHYIYGHDTFRQDGTLLERGAIISKYEAISPEDMLTSVMKETAYSVNRQKTPGQKEAAFRGLVGKVSDRVFNTQIALWSKTMDDGRGESADGIPMMKHIAHASACAFCKMFDMNDYKVSSTSKRPHVGCKCVRIPLAYGDSLIDTQPWREEFEDMEAEVWRQAQEEGEILSYSDMMSRLRKANKK